MKLKKDEIIKMATISCIDADARLEEFEKYKTFEPNPNLLNRQKMLAMWPQAKYFDYDSIEGWTGILDDSLFIMFRGSDSLMDWFRNFIFAKAVVPYDGTNPAIKVHQGFIEDYLLIRSFIHDTVRASTLNKVKIFGHSMGAALTGLAALDIQYNFPTKQIGAFAIGMPNVGNKEFKRSFEGRLPDFTRVEYGNDLVSQVPPQWMNFFPVNTGIHMGPKRNMFIGTMRDHNWNLYLTALKAELKDGLYS